MGKIYEQYVYKFYLTAAHSIIINNSMGQRHSHTWEITLDVTNSNKTFIRFDEIEKMINSILDKYQRTYLNEMPPLNKINPTLENLCEYFKNVFKYNLAKEGFILLMIEMSETASRSYIINLTKDELDSKVSSEDALLNSLYNTKESDVETFLRDIKRFEDVEKIEEKPVVQKEVKKPKKDFSMEFDIEVDDDDDFDYDTNEKKFSTYDDDDIIDLDALYADEIKEIEREEKRREINKISKKEDSKSKDNFDNFLSSLYNSKK